MIHSSRKPVPPTRFQKFAKKSAETSAIPLLIVAFALAFAVHFVVRPVMFVLSVVPTLLVRASGEPMN